MELQRIGMKVFCREGAEIPLVEFIPVFHRWIQKSVTDTLLIDVADYSHVVDGPGILLAAYEGNYAVDETHGRRGLVYYQKVDQVGEIGERLEVICRRLLHACVQLQSEPEFEGRLTFDASEIEIFSNDRLLGPNSAESYAQFEPHVTGLLSKLFAGDGANCSTESDRRERMTYRAKHRSGDATLSALLEHLSA